MEGVGGILRTLGERDTALRNLLSNASKATGVLSQRADEVAQLVANSNALLAELRSQSAALEQISRSLSNFAQQLKAFIDENQQQMRPALDKLNGVLTIVDNRKERVLLAIKYLNQYTMGLGETVGSGPFFKAYLANLPGQLIQPFIDAAFSDLGLDPNVLPLSQLSDPQTGQPGTPALPMPFPRTGQGGEPHLNLPDAITGNPGDPRYPYREPEPAPPLGVRRPARRHSGRPGSSLPHSRHHRRLLTPTRLRRQKQPNPPVEDSDAQAHTASRIGGCARAGVDRRWRNGDAVAHRRRPHEDRGVFRQQQWPVRR